MHLKANLNKLRWRSRRGMLELDLLLIPFFDDVFTELSHEDQVTYEKLLDQDDPDLIAWFSQKQVPEDRDLAALVNRILNRVQPSNP